MILSPIWLPATLLAGATQAWRTAVQRRVGQSLSINGAGLVRYLYGLPFALAMLMTYHWMLDRAWPSLTMLFFLFCVAGGLAQIIATNLLIMSFSHRNFVVGTAYSKTEAVQSALLSFFLMSEVLTPVTLIGIGFGVIGVMILSTDGKRMGPLDFVKALRQPAALTGLASGFFFALTAVGIRRATQEVGSSDAVYAALTTVSVTVLLQTLMQGGYMVVRERSELHRVFSSWRISGQVGLLSAIGSACWFTGFATAPVALVRIVGQVEIAFTMAFGHFYLRERIRRFELIGLMMIICGVVFALMGSL